MNVLEMELTKDFWSDYPLGQLRKPISWLIKPKYLKYSQSGIDVESPTHYFQNKSIKIPIYDKTEELKAKFGADFSKALILDDQTYVIRVETTLKNPKIIKTFSNIQTISDLWKREKFESLNKTFSNVIRKRLQFPKELTDPNYEVECVGLSELEQQKSAKALHRFLIQLGITPILLHFKTMEEFKSTLKKLGFSETSIKTQARELSEIIVRSMNNDEVRIAQDFIQKLIGEE